MLKELQLPWPIIFVKVVMKFSSLYFQRQIIIIELIRKLKSIICLRIQENVQYFLE